MEQNRSSKGIGEVIMSFGPTPETTRPVSQPSVYPHNSNIVRSNPSSDISYDSTNKAESEEEVVITDGDDDTMYGSFPPVPYDAPRQTTKPKNYSSHYPQSEASDIHTKNRPNHLKNGYYLDTNSEPVPEFDYWMLPRTREILERSAEPSFYDKHTPGAKLFKHKAHKSGHKKHKQRNDMYTLLRTGIDSWSRRNADSLLLDPKEIANRGISDRTVFFRFARRGRGREFDLDEAQIEPFILVLQAYSRGWLVRQDLFPIKNENEAVRIIQRNAERFLNPWFRLLLSLRPLLSSHRLEEEILFLQSEIERYKNLIKLLRFENVSGQVEINNLRQLLDEINMSGQYSDEINKLVQQTQETLTKNQLFWNEMALNHQDLPSTLTNNSNLNVDGNIFMVSSPLTQMKRDADFYRTQVEMLEEEANVQNQRSSEHFRDQVQAFGERVENLQHLLTLENNKVERLTAEIDELNNMINQGKNYERNLEYMVTQLSNQLEQKNKNNESTAKSPRFNENPNSEQSESKADKQLKYYRDLVAQLRSCIQEHPALASTLEQYPLNLDGLMYGTKDEVLDSGIIVSEAHPLVASSVPDLSSSHTRAQEEIMELRRQLLEAEGAIKEELKDRETLEIENQQLHEKITSIDRQLRRKKDEFDEAAMDKDRVHMRKVEELRDQLDEETLKNSKLSQIVRDMERELLNYRNLPEPDEEDDNQDQWKALQSKLRLEAAHYEQAFKALQDEYDQFRRDHNPVYAKEQLTEKEDLIRLLESEKQQWRTESDLHQVKLQTTTTLLEGSENRVKMLSKERTGYLHRISVLENERDDAVKQAATISGRSIAEKEHFTSKLRELEEIRLERDNLRKELMDVKHERVESVAERSAENRQLQARLREVETLHEARITDLKYELERSRDEIQRLQLDLQSIQSSELEHKSSNQQFRRKIDELEDQLSNSLRRISALERHNSDLNSELIRANADLGAIREAANMKRASRTRMLDEFYQASEDDTEDDSTIGTFRDGFSSPFGRRSMSSSANRSIHRPVSTTSMSSVGLRRSSPFSQASTLKREDTSTSSQNLRQKTPRPNSVIIDIASRISPKYNSETNGNGSQVESEQSQEQP